MRPNLLLIISLGLMSVFAIKLPKREVIKLYPNPSFDGKITVSTTLTDTLHFYIFDLEGTLINQTVLTNKEKKTITNLSKGTYMYDVFESDESIEEGKIFIK